MLGALMYLFLWVSFAISRRLWFRWSVSGVSNLPPRHQMGMILASNHLDWTDIHVIGASLPLAYRPSWIAKSEIFRNPIVKWWLYQMQVIPIQRGKRDTAALDEAVHALKQGAVVVIFPEGHRSRTGGLQHGRGGAVRLAIASGCPIVPVALHGTEHGPRGALSRKPIHVHFGEPYYPKAEDAALPKDRMDQLTEEMMLHIATILPEQYQGVYHQRMLEQSSPVAE
ncbi:MAG: hypothetical protein GFH27_549307n26 [Chloroflexi bacterium AL-W]|nr:hypothetical protein [Chloroflexi bacterium AL-N1]NOK69058.1 hypothetical protein [Chloroflexi bacterium AL-N10]NOK77041.1 hypothetical protein [Chloroflexi bacterium AL-N5]NOK83686.1 hypothetical protein [Chloroflexi bacterium AL-W]NOK90896.1 hypothetical protein [Chloroflexi bacterium AL-N15]